MVKLEDQNYPKIEAEVKSVAEELGIDHPCNDILFGDATVDDEERIRSALDGEDAIPGSGDWAVKLGINLFYSANLKQMAYNCVIYSAFGRMRGLANFKKFIHFWHEGIVRKKIKNEASMPRHLQMKISRENPKCSESRNNQGG
ncbi:hypothetical protein GOBAR_DD35869 [Gossypium barbadense]|nr:hypothetical protein GOBAR_DD35869 [Gossypium barbadense]